jgi:hypothetical protein
VKKISKDEAIKAAASHIVGEGTGGINFKTDERFRRGGEFESLGDAVQQIRPGDDWGIVQTILDNIRAAYEQEPGKLALADGLREALMARFNPHDAEDDNPKDYHTLADLAKLIGETVYVWDNYIMAGGLNAIAGDVGAGKTLLAADLHRRQWFGLGWPDGTEVKEPGKKVVWLMADQRPGQLVDIAKDMGFPEKSIIIAAEEDEPMIPLGLDHKSLLSLNDMARDVKPWAVIVDTFTSAMGSREQTKPEIMNLVTSGLLDIALAHNIPIILLCHTNSEGGVYGKALERKTEHIITLRFTDKTDKRSERNLSCNRSRRMENTTKYGVIFNRNGLSYGFPHEEVEPNSKATKPPTKKDATEQTVMAMAAIAGDGGITQAEIAELIQKEEPDTKPNTIRARVSRAFTNLYASKRLREKDGRFYQFLK